MTEEHKDLTPEALDDIATMARGWIGTDKPVLLDPQLAIDLTVMARRCAEAEALFKTEQAYRIKREEELENAEEIAEKAEADLLSLSIQHATQERVIAKDRERYLIAEARCQELEAQVVPFEDERLVRRRQERVSIVNALLANPALTHHDNDWIAKEADAVLAQLDRTEGKADGK